MAAVHSLSVEHASLLAMANNDACSTDKLCTAAICDVQQGCQEEVIANCCGNNIVEGNESCDDGNSIDDDSCTAQCQKNCQGIVYDGVCLRYQKVNDKNFNRLKFLSLTF